MRCREKVREKKIIFSLLFFPTKYHTGKENDLF